MSKDSTVPERVLPCNATAYQSTVHDSAPRQTRNSLNLCNQLSLFPPVINLALPMQSESTAVTPLRRESHEGVEKAEPKAIEVKVS